MISKLVSSAFTALKRGRLIVLFVLCVLLPTIPLAYLALQSITGEPETISGKINIHLERLGDSFIRMAGKPLLDYEEELVEQIHQDFPLSELAPGISDVTKACPYFASFFILDSRLNPLFPFGESGVEAAEFPEVERSKKGMENFTLRMKEGNMNEFVASDWGKAFAEYEQAARAVLKNPERIVALNAAARCCTKMGRYEEADSRYNDILSRAEENVFFNCFSMKLLAMYRMALTEEKMGEATQFAGHLLDIVRALADGQLAGNVYEASFYSSMIEQQRDKLNNMPGLAEDYMSKLDYALEEWGGMKRAALTMERLRGRCRLEFQKIFAEGTEGDEAFRTISTALDGEETLLANRLIGTGVSDTPSILVAVLDLEELREKMRFIVNDYIESEPDINLGVYASDGSVIAEGGNPADGTDLKIKRSLAPSLPIWWLTITYRKNGLLLEMASSEKRTRISYILLLIVIILLGIYVTYRSIRKDSELARLKSDFVSRVSHELRTPLATIRAVGEMLEIGAVSSREKEKEYFSVITAESERLSRLINNVLDFSKIGAGKRTYNIGPADLKRAVSNTVRAFSEYVKLEGFDVVYEAGDDIPGMLIDEDAISQALINLMDNAVKFSGGKKVIWVNLERMQDEIRLSVRDKGIGITPGDIERIFDRFYRLEEARKVSRRGAGIGLSIVKHIAEAHGGRIDVRSKHGEGSVFTLVLPIRPQPRIKKQ